MKKVGYGNVDEPFAGLFTQGMITHETYRAEDGRWLFPDEVDRRDDGTVVARDGGGPVTVGPAEKMSKSKKNVVSPEAILDTYGVDAARWFMLSDTPPERDSEWTKSGVEGAWRLIQRIWRIIDRVSEVAPPAGSPMPSAFGSEADALRRATHKALDAVSNDIERLRFNRAIAHVYEIVNALNSAVQVSESGDLADDLRWALRESAEIVVRISAPMVPHLAEEAWRALGHDTMLATSPWPQVETGLLIEDTITLPVQVNGKRRDELTIGRDADASAIEAAVVQLPGVRRALGEAPIRKIIVVPQRIVNVVI